MRVISQDGTFDVPYEISSFSMAVGKYDGVEHAAIYCHNSSTAAGTKMAEYNSKEKAKKAMKQLRDVYEDYLAEGTPDGNGFCFVPPKVFQFPAEEELD